MHSEKHRGPNYFLCNFFYCTLSKDQPNLSVCCSHPTGAISFNFNFNLFHPLDNNVYRIQPSFLIISLYNSIYWVSVNNWELLSSCVQCHQNQTLVLTSQMKLVGLYRTVCGMTYNFMERCTRTQTFDKFIYNIWQKCEIWDSVMVLLRIQIL